MSLLRLIRLLLICGVVSGCALPSAKKHLEVSFLAQPSEGTLIRNVPFSPTLSETGLKPAAIALTRYWKLGTKVRSTWMEYIEQPEKDDLFDDYSTIQRTLAKEGIWLFSSPMSEIQLHERLDAGVPLLVFQAPLPLQPTEVKIRILAGYNNRQAAYFVFDGTDGPLIQPQSTFLDQHRNTLRYTIIFCPESAIQWELSPPESESLAQYHEWRDEWDRARSLWHRRILEKPSNAGFWVRAGNADLKLGQIEGAKENYREAIAADPSYGAAYNNLAYLLAEENPDQALTLAQQALALTPDSAQVIDTLALVLMELNRPDEASAWLERGRPHMKHLPPEEQLDFLTRLATAYGLAGQDHLARQVVNQLYKIQPGVRLPESLFAYRQAHHPVLWRK